MSKNTNKLVPKLRFPEFRDNWLLVPLGKCFTNIGGTALEKYVTEGAKHHFISIGNYTPEGKYIDKRQRIEANDVTRAKLLNKNDLVMVLNDKTLAGDIIGSTLLIDEDDKYIYNQRSERLIVGKNFTPIFAWHLLNSKNVRKEVFKRSQGGTQIYVNFPAVKAISLYIPKEPKEQQKIADCLSGIDELISTQSQKVEALKTHKKGLMQQLFPREGETVPRLRFPGFRDAGEWEEKELIKFSDCGLSNGVFNDPKKVGSGYKLINVLDMYIDTVIDETKLSLVELSENEFSKNKVENGDIFFTRSSLVKSGIAYSNIYTGNSCNITFDGHLIMFRPNKSILSPMFANYLLRTSKVRSQLVARGKSATMTTIGQADVGGIKLAVPTNLNEQQKIADCLSSIDDLISAQNQKLEALKTHKKGLMQQLFPSFGGVDSEAGRGG